MIALYENGMQFTFNKIDLGDPDSAANLKQGAVID
jgi:hypothetical protein